MSEPDDRDPLEKWQPAGAKLGTFLNWVLWVLIGIGVAVLVFAMVVGLTILYWYLAKTPGRLANGPSP